jgi:hypothetical protein
VADPAFASLSPSLLARKGGAKPAMRPQHAALASMPQEPVAAAPEQLEDLGWNDMGEGDAPTADVVRLTPLAPAVEPSEGGSEQVRPAVLLQQDSIAQRVAAEQPRVRSTPKPSVARVNRAAFTLRLDAQRHLKLRLATTIRGSSAQALVTEALDALLAAMPELDTLAAQVKRR